MQNTLRISLFCLLFFGTILPGALSGQTIVWSEDFDDDSPTVVNWQVDDGSNGSGTQNSNPTPGSTFEYTAGGAGTLKPDIIAPNTLTYTPATGNDGGIGSEPSHSAWVIDAEHTPITPGSANGSRSACTAYEPFPNPNPGGGVVNQSLHIERNIDNRSALIGDVLGLYDDGDGYSYYDDSHNPSDGGYPFNYLSGSDQWVPYNADINTTGVCDMTLAFDAYLGGDAAGAADMASRLTDRSVLYSIDGGTTWKVLEDNLTFLHFTAGACNGWQRIEIDLPADAEDIPNLRIGFRWRNSNPWPQTSADYSMFSGFNVDNVEISTEVPTLDATFTASDATPCINNISTFTPNTPSAGATYTWSVTGTEGVDWDFAGGTTANDETVQIEFLTVDAQDVTLTMDQCFSSDNTTQNVAPENCLNAEFSGTLTAVCATAGSPTGATITVFTDLSTSSGTITNYTWTVTGPGTETFENATTANSQNPEISFDTPGLYTIELEVDDDNALTDTETKVDYIEVGDCECGGVLVAGPREDIVVYDFEPSTDGWTLNTLAGTESASPNPFFHGSQEPGHPAGTCTATAGASTDQSIFVGSVVFGSGSGAAYNAAQTTDRSIVSPSISTVGYQNIQVSYDYLMNGEPVFDVSTFYYSIDGGASWSLFDFPPRTTDCSVTTLIEIIPGFFFPITTPGREWENRVRNLPAACDQQPDLRIRVQWENDNSIGSDPSFAIDDVIVTGEPLVTGVVSGNEYTGPNGDSWGTDANWSLTDAPDTFTEDATIPAGKIVTVDAAYDVRNVCNYGEIIIDKAAGGQLNIEGNLLNEGIIRSTDGNANADVRFVTGPSLYRGLGTNNDVDYHVVDGDLTLQADLSCRSMTVDADTDFDVYTLTLKRDYTHNAGTISAANATMLLDGPCLACVDNGTDQDLFLNAPGTWSTLEVDKTAGSATMFNGNLTVNDDFILTSGNFDQQANRLQGTANATQTGGGWRSTAAVGPQPFLTGTYDLQSGFVLFTGTTTKILRGGISYNELRIAGSGTHNQAGDIEVRSLLQMRDNPVLNTQTNRLYGAGGLTMQNNATLDPTINIGTITANPLPELSGAYTNVSTDGKIALTGNGAQTFKFLNAWRVGFEGPGVKSVTILLLANGSLTFNQAGAATPGNYVDASAGTIFLTDATPDSLIHADNASSTGGGHGHVSGGALRREVTGTNSYFYPLGSDGSTALFYEPANLTFTTAYASITDVTANFSVIQPSPYDIDDVTDPTDGKLYGYLENDGFWNFSPDDATDNSGAYTMEVFPSGGWTFTTADYALLKTTPWDFHASTRVSNTSRSDYTEFSGFAFGVNVNPLPVQASPLTAQANGDRITLNWLTFSESNNAGFELYRTTTPSDESSYSQIAFVTPTSKVGEHKYVHQDTDVQPDVTYYYRYVQVDLDGKTTRSNVASAKLDAQSQTTVQVYPNPFSQQLNFDLMMQEASGITLEVVDATGRMVYTTTAQREAGRQYITWAPDHLSAGMYHYTLRLDNGQHFSGKLVYRP